MWSRFKVLKTLWYENLSNNHNQENMILHTKEYCTGHKKIEKKNLKWKGDKVLAKHSRHPWQYGDRVNQARDSNHFYL